MAGINRVIIIGSLGKDPEVRKTPDGKTISNISVATSETWKDKQTGEQQEKTEWHRIVFFNRLAEIVSEYLNKGSKVYIEGKLQNRKWQDKEGNDRYTTEIVAREMQMLDARHSRSQLSRTSHQQPQKPAAQGDGGAGVFDDDIPF